MLKTRNRLLVTLILAVVASTVVSTVSAARDLASRDGSVSSGGAGIVKPAPVTYTGEPDTPLAPLPGSQPSGGVSSPSPSDDDSNADEFAAFYRRISWIWAMWYMGTAF